MIGTKLGPYEITAKLGEGGMGEVYRATDTKLRRDVAIKVLPAAFVEDTERLARFEREAQLLAQLHHPNIASVFGLEESAGTRALVMELVEGPTLADRLESGALSFGESISIARQIAEALEEAHDKGIIHRDLKPQNIKAPTAGKVKVLDFGLAKAMDPSSIRSASASELAHSPTVTHGATMHGVILGTAAYMAPEQAKGSAVDKRADIWALGVILLEMLTGQRIFAGDSVTETLAAVLRAEIPLGELPAGTPGSVRRLLRRCLERDPAHRLHDVADLRIVLADVQAGRADDLVTAVAGESSSSSTRSRATMVVGALGLSAIAFLAGWALRRPPAPSTPPVADDAIVRKLTFEPGLEAEPSFSPDGNYLAYTANDRGSLDIAVLPVDGGQMRRLVDSPADDAQPAWSPDGTRVAFTSARDRTGRLSALGGLNALTPFVQAHGGDLFLVPAGGGPAVRLVERGSYPTWSPDGQQIAFQSDRGGNWDIWRVPARGGEPVPIVTDDEIDYQPSWSPDGAWVAFASSSGLRVAPSDGSARPRLLLAAPTAILSPTWSRDGRSILFSWNRTGAIASLWRLDFRPDDDGAPRPERISLGEQSAIDLAVSAAGGRLAWSRVEYAPDIWEIERATAELRQITATSSSEDYPHLAPDGQSLAMVSDRAGAVGIWILHRNDGTLEAMTPPGVNAFQPHWSPDGRSVVFVSRDGEGHLTLVIQERGALAARVWKRAADVREGLSSPKWSPDGSRIVFVREHASGEHEVVVGEAAVQGTGGGEERSLARFPPGQSAADPSFLNDGSTVAFQHEIPGQPRQIWLASTAGGEARELTHGTVELSHPRGSPRAGDEILVIVDHKNLAIVSARTGELEPLTRFDDSTVVLDYPSWSADGRTAVFSLSRKVGDLFLLENPERP